MNAIFKRSTLFVLALAPLAAQAHPGHPESDHFVGAAIILAAGCYALKVIAGFAVKHARIRRR